MALIAAGQDVTAAFLNQTYSLADTAAQTVTAATQQPLSTTYNIPANEPSVNSAYEVRFGGTGIWATAGPQLIALTFVISGVVVVNTINGIAAAAFNTSAGFRFTGYAQFVFSATGASGGVFADLCYTFSETANAVNPGAAGTNTLSVADSNSTVATIDTTATMPVTVKAGWASVTGTPTISNRKTIFRKIA